MERKTWKVARASRLVVALAAIAAVPGHARGLDGVPKEAETLSAGFRKAAKAVLPAVVTVRAAGPRRVVTLPPTEVFPFRGRFEPETPPPGEEGGSGVVIDAGKGYVLTNDHVVHGASRVVVTLHDGQERTVTQIRSDPRSDLALLSIDPKGLTQAEWGDSQDLDTGDWVLAVGQPFGISGTVTAGIVSGKGRGVGLAAYEDLIQTDAAINPGNSGGPLVDLDGRVVGITTLIKTRRGGFEGIGFAVPASRARRVASDLAATGRVRRAFVGVAIAPVDPSTGRKLEQPGAVVINEVSPGGPADRAGLKRGDVITKFDGHPLRGLGALQSEIEFAEVDKPVTLTVDRGGEAVTVEVRPVAQPERAGRAEPELVETRRLNPAPRHDDFRDLGLRLAEPDPVLARRFRLGEPSRGLVVTGVTPDGPADQGGIEIGMVITDLAGQRVDSLDAARKALEQRPKDRDLLIRVLRGPKAEFRVIVATPGERPPDPPRPVGREKGEDQEGKDKEPQ